MHIIHAISINDDMMMMSLRWKARLRTDDLEELIVISLVIFREG